MMLKVVRDETPPLSRDELKERGDALVTDARRFAIDAMRESMHSEFLAKHVGVTPARLRQWRHRARTARDAWQRVDDVLSELLREVEKASRAPGGSESMPALCAHLPSGRARPVRVRLSHGSG